MRRQGICRARDVLEQLPAAGQAFWQGWGRPWGLSSNSKGWSELAESSANKAWLSDGSWFSWDSSRSQPGRLASPVCLALLQSFANSQPRDPLSNLAVGGLSGRLSQTLLMPEAAIGPALPVATLTLRHQAPPPPCSLSALAFLKSKEWEQEGGSRSLVALQG